MYRMRRPADFLPLFRHRPLRPADGAFRYNNAGYILLGLIVEQVSKMTFTEYVEQSIFARPRCGIPDTSHSMHS